MEEETEETGKLRLRFSSGVREYLRCYTLAETAEKQDKKRNGSERNSSATKGRVRALSKKKVSQQYSHVRKRYFDKS